MTTLVEVTQADRDLAAASQEGWPVTQRAIRMGGHDHGVLVQAFARHRLVSEQSSAVTRLQERVAELEAELASRPQWAGGKSPITCGSGGVSARQRLNKGDAS